MKEYEMSARVSGTIKEDEARLADPEPVSTTKQSYGDCLSSDLEPQPVSFGRQHFEPKRDSDRLPWDATPSSAGTVSVEAAARVIVEAWDADTLPVADPDPMLPAFIAALRALAGEGGR